MNAAPEAQPLAGGAYLRLVLLGALVGVPAALVAAHAARGKRRLDAIPAAVLAAAGAWLTVTALDPRPAQ